MYVYHYRGPWNWVSSGARQRSGAGERYRECANGLRGCGRDAETIFILRRAFAYYTAPCRLDIYLKSGCQVKNADRNRGTRGKRYNVYVPVTQMMTMMTTTTISVSVALVSSSAIVFTTPQHDNCT